MAHDAIASDTISSGSAGPTTPSSLEQPNTPSSAVPVLHEGVANAAGPVAVFLDNAQVFRGAQMVNGKTDFSIRINVCKSDLRHPAAYHRLASPA
eukprot:gene222-2375_t